MSIDVIESILKRVTGVDSASRGSTMLHRAVSERMRQLAFSSIDSYTELVSDNDKELQALIDELMVTETWFFRDCEPFRYLLDFASSWLTQGQDQPLRVLSLPCATGEEPYSIAMILIQSGLNRNQFSVDAVDISTRALRYAKRGVFGRHSFRHENDDIQQRFFQKKKNGYSVNDLIRNAVQFSHKNFWDVAVPEQAYDIVFCRNLLIYFDAETQQRAVFKLHQMIRDRGLLFVGHAETLCVGTSAHFQSEYTDGAFAYRHLEAANELAFDVENNDHVEPQEGEAVNSPAHLSESDYLRPQHRAVRQKINRVILSVDQAERYELEQAQRHLDDGCVEEAAVICREHIRRYPDSAQAFYLLGTCSEHDGLQRLAVKLYKKSIALEPAHYQAIMRLVTVLEQAGNLVAAAIYKERANRIIYGNEKRAMPEA